MLTSQQSPLRAIFGKHLLLHLIEVGSPYLFWVEEESADVAVILWTP